MKIDALEQTNEFQLNQVSVSLCSNLTYFIRKEFILLIHQKSNTLKVFLPIHMFLNNHELHFPLLVYILMDFFHLTIVFSTKITIEIAFLPLNLHIYSFMVAMKPVSVGWTSHYIDLKSHPISSHSLLDVKSPKVTKTDRE